MSIRVLVSDRPHRSVALVTETHVLHFKHVQPGRDGVNTSATSLGVSHKKEAAPRCMVEFSEKTAVDLQGYRTLTSAKGTLGLITLGDDVFVCVVTGSHEVATVRPGETVMRIFAVEFYCLNRSDYDHAGGYGAGYRDGYREPNPYPNHVFDDEHGYDSGDTASEHPFNALKKLLSGGTFYYSYNFDLTRRLQDRADADSTLDIDSLDDGLLWNSYMINPLISFRSRLTPTERQALDQSSILTSVIRGYAGTLTIPTNVSPIRSVKTNYPATLSVISRLSARRAGTRFNSRGIDDDGNVANFVETETIFWSPTGVCFSYVQIRGSVPVFWESSSSLIPGQQKIQITRSPEATQLSFDRHFENLERIYGIVHIVDLLSESKQGEVELSERYHEHVRRISPPQKEGEAVDDGGEDGSHHIILRSTKFDFHEQARAAGGYEGAKHIKPLIEHSAESFVYFLMQDIEDDVETVEHGKPVVKRVTRSVGVMQQSGVFRTNCLDCLDRTNLIQGLISQMALELFLEHRGEIASNSNLSVFWMRHSTLWADNGDALSKIYAGTGALKSSFTRHGKMSLAGFVADARKSATRLYVNHFEDKGRQNTTDLLLGRLVGQEEVELVDPVSDWVHEQLRKRADEFEQKQKKHVWVGTYNLNGQVMKDRAELRKWFRSVDGHEIVVVGFQEIVELSPQQIMSTDPGRRIVWERAVKETLNARASEKGGDTYILLRSGQLVGAALMIFVKAYVLTKVKNVEGAIKKTGVSGLAGNKGAVACRMEIEGSSVCFVTAHLAAGFGNYDERNRDYQTIVHGLRFQRGRKVEDHEVVIWLGDFNYRIGTMPETARNLINVYRNQGGQGQKAQDALAKLYNDDQLNIQMVAGQTFPFYTEGKITFLPTYKFDLGNDDYDTSEKARIPAWTDRILWKLVENKGTHIKQLEYNSVMDLRFSDHRPVYSSFEVEVRVIDEEKKTALLKKLYAKRSEDLKAGIDDSSDSEDLEEIMGYQSVAPGLPPASSDKRKWWLDSDQAVASRVKPPAEGMVLNRDRSGNPWKENGEDEWVMVDKVKPEPPAPRKQTKVPIQAPRALPPAYDDFRIKDDGLQIRDKTPERNAAPPKPPAPRSSTPVSSVQQNLPVTGRSSRQPSVSSTQAPPPAPPSRHVSGASALQTQLNPPIQRTLSSASTTSAASSTARRSVAPPKPVKPLSLTSTGTSHNASSTTAAPAQPETFNRIQMVDNDSIRDRAPPPLPSRTANTTAVPKDSNAGNDTPGPPLPPRRGNGQQREDLLDDNSQESTNGNDLEGWQPLVPKK